MEREAYTWGPMTRGQARRWANWVIDFAGWYGVTLCESFPSGELWIKGYNGAGRSRIIRSVEDFNAIKEASSRSS